MAITSLDELLVHELEDLHHAEKQILKALPKMAKAAEHPDLRKAFEKHRQQTEEQVRRLDKIFKQLDEKPSGKKCKGMEGLIEEGEEILQEDMSEGLRDAALIGAAQKVEHYEIAGYGTARELARRLGLDNAVNLLQETLDEESETDELLTEIAERVNREAEAAD